MAWRGCYESNSGWWKERTFTVLSNAMFTILQKLIREMECPIIVEAVQASWNEKYDDYDRYEFHYLNVHKVKEPVGYVERV